MNLGIYRKGQGIGPRGIAVAALGLVALFGTAELHGGLRRVASLGRPLVSWEIPFLEARLALTWGVLLSAGVLAACVWGIWLLMNHAKTVDFLIETGDEMRKVSWPWDPAAQGVYWWILPNKGRELFNNSLVVIIGVFLLAGVLFVFDMALSQALLRVVGAR